MRTLTALCLLLLLSAAPATAQGIVLERIRPRPPTPPPHRPYPIQLREHRVRISIDEQVATTEVVQVFYNPNPQQMEGVYIFPLPEDAAISRFTLMMGGKDIEGEVLSADKARRIYRSIVERRRDPGLLEYMGRGLLRASIFPIPARGDARVTLRYSQVLREEGGLIEMVYPLKSDHFAAGAVAVSGEIEVRDKAGVANLFSPTHKLDIARKSDTHVKASFEERASRADRDLRLLYTRQRKDLSMALVTHNPAAEDGYFLLLVSPRTEIRPEDILPKDVVFIFDTSGSMAGKKLEQAKGALSYALNNLAAKDRFNIVTFSTEARMFRTGLVAATKENVAAALDHVKQLNATGGTAIHEALTAALGIPREEGRVPIALFLTDGRPTIGPTDVGKILRQAKQVNGAAARVFVFGVGNDVNTRLLGDLAQDHSGTTQYVKESEDIEVKVSVLFDQVSSPVLTDVTVDLGELGQTDVYPRRVGDLFKGQQLSVVGRYKHAGDRVIRLRGKIGSRDVTHTYEATFGAGKGEVHLPRLWAVRKVGFLLEEIRRNGERKELVNTVRELGVRHGIVTPYTSFLVVEDEAMLRGRRDSFGINFYGPNGGIPPGLRAHFDPLVAEETLGLGGVGDRADGEKDDAWAKTRAKAARKSLDEARNAFRERRAVGKQAVDGATLAALYTTAKRAGGYTGLGVKFVGQKTFRLTDGIWQDYELPKVAEIKKVVYLSDEYFELINDDELARYLSVGPRVRVLHKGVVYEVVLE
ncbi:MAG: VIT domain-containing protein [Planctomycetota bacterium]|nr:VIT domain-containing protein [Planctomycetota bacterium]